MITLPTAKAETETPALTDEQARAYAARWDARREARSDPTVIVSGSPSPETQAALVEAARAAYAKLYAEEDGRLFAWVRSRVAEYVKGCLTCIPPWTWSATVESDREAMAGWIAVDLGLGDEDDFASALALCKSAGWT